MAPKPLNIHATCGSSTSIIVSTRNNFLSKVCQKFSLNEDKIEIFDIKAKKIIGIEDLRDFIKVEIKKRNVHAVNGRSHSSGPAISKEPVKKMLENRVLTGKDSPGPPVSEEIIRHELTRKMVDDVHLAKVLTSEERAFLVKLLTTESYQPPLKRRKEDDSLRPEMKHRKLQVDSANLIATRDYWTQTDKLINYKPDLNTSIAANDIMIQSKRLANTDKIDAAIASDLMSKTFDKRRNFMLLDRPLALLVKEKYPLLFSNAEVRNEMDRIFYDGKCSEFLGNIQKYAPYILSVAREDDPLVQKTRNKMDALKTVPQKQYAQEVGALLMLSSLVHEGRDYIKLSEEPKDQDDFPYIQCNAKENDLYFDQHLFKIYVERTQLCEASDFKEAVLCLMGCYFIFNIQYPDVNFNTLVTFEKLFLCANDTDENDVDLAVRQIIRSIQLKYSAKSGS